MGAYTNTKDVRLSRSESWKITGTIRRIPCALCARFHTVKSRGSNTWTDHAVAQWGWTAAGV